MEKQRDAIDIVHDRIDALPLDQGAVYHALSLLGDPNTNFDRLSESLSPFVALRLLATAAETSGVASVRSIHFAVKALGYHKIRQALICSVLVDRFTRQADFAYFDFQKFSDQAHLCAAIAQALGKMVDFPSVEDLFTAAVFHNLGKMVIAVHFPVQLQQIVSLKQAEGICSREAERRVLGTDHGQIGAAVLEHLHLPEDLCAAVRYHNAEDPTAEAAAAGEMPAILHAASRAAGRFALPGQTTAAEIGDTLQEAVENGRHLYRKKFPQGRLTRGYLMDIAEFLRIGAGLIELDLKKVLTTRTGA